MCRQDYGECRNLNCKGRAQILGLHLCGNRPNCEIKYQKVPRPQDGEPYCPDCRNLTMRERKNRTQRALRATKKQSDKAYTAVAAGLGGAQAAAVEQGESSTMGENRPVTLGGEFDLSPDHFFAGPEETGEPLPPQGENRDLLPNSIGDSAPGARLPEPHPSTPQIPIDPALLHVDRILSRGSDWARNMQDAQQFLADFLSGSNNPGDKDGEESGDKDGEESGDKDGEESGDKDGEESGDKDDEESGDKDGEESSDKDGEESSDKDVEESSDLEKLSEKEE